MNLLQSTWLDVLCFNLAFRSTPYKGLLVHADDFKCSEEDTKKFGSPVEMDTIARKLARKLSDLNITREEYVIMKSMLLLNPGRYKKGAKTWGGRWGYGTLEMCSTQSPPNRIKS